MAQCSQPRSFDVARTTSVLTQPEAGGVVIEIGNPPGAALVDDADDHCRPLVSSLENATEAAAGGTRTASSWIDFSGIVRFIFPRLGEERKYNCEISQVELRIVGRRYGLVLSAWTFPLLAAAIVHERRRDLA
jgi:hypothetical protein